MCVYIDIWVNIVSTINVINIVKVYRIDIFIFYYPNTSRMILNIIEVYINTLAISLKYLNLSYIIIIVQNDVTASTLYSNLSDIRVPIPIWSE